MSTLFSSATTIVLLERGLSMGGKCEPVALRAFDLRSTGRMKSLGSASAKGVGLEKGGTM